MDLRAGEVARDIAGFEGLYAITSHGRVWAYSRKIVGCGNRKEWTQPGHWMVPQVSGNPDSGQGGYLQVGLSRGGKRKLLCLHLLVAEAFIPNPFHRDGVNHKDGHKPNCREDNLEWCTHAENMEHARRNGLYARQSSKFRGVSFNRHKQRWVAFATEGGKYKYIGQFKTESEAVAAHDEYVSSRSSEG